MQFSLFKANAIATQADKRQRQFDRAIEDWKGKFHDIQRELESANTQSRANAAETFRLKAQLEESHDGMDALRRENKNLAGYLNLYIHRTSLLGQRMGNITTSLF